MARNYYDENNGNRSSGPSTTGILGGLGAIGVGLLKFGALKTVLTMGLSILIQAQYMGWPVAIGFVCLIFFHEMGHVLKASEYGVPVTAPTFIPFFGAYVLIQHENLNGWQRAMVSLAGPIAGGFSSLAFLLAGIVFRQDWLETSAALGFFMNLFNLLPLGGLDGRNVCAAIHSNFWIFGAILVIGLIFLINPYALITMFLFLLPFLFLTGTSQMMSYVFSEMTTTARTGAAILYLFTVLGLAFASYATQDELPHRAPVSSYSY